MRATLSGPAAACFLAKWRVSASLAGCTVNRARNGKILELRSRSSTAELGASTDSTCSNLNFSAQAITGRQMIWSIRIMIPIITPSPQTIARVFPAFAAVCRYEPRPGRRKSRFPSVNISQAIRKNQPPATDIIEFHTSPMMEYGNSICVKRCHQLQRYTSATSRISRGMLFSDE